MSPNKSSITNLEDHELLTYRNSLAKALSLVKKTNAKAARIMLSDSQSWTVYKKAKLLQNQRRPQVSENNTPIDTLEKPPTLDEQIESMIADPNIIFRMSSTYSPVLNVWEPWNGVYHWECKEGKRIPKTMRGYLDPRSMDARGTIQMLTGGRAETACAVWKTTDDKWLEYVVVFPDNRFDKRSSVSGFYITIPRDNDHYKALMSPEVIVRAFVFICPEFFRAKPVEGWRKNSKYWKELYADIIEGANKFLTNSKNRK